MVGWLATAACFVDALPAPAWVTRDSCMQVVKERLLCHTVVGSKAGKAQIMQMDVTCEFVDPVLQVSTREIAFQVEKVSLRIASWH